MAITLNNPVVHGMKYAAQNVDAYVRSAVCDVEVTNGTLVTLDEGFSDKSQGYVFKATVVSADTAKDVWMVREPEVPKDVCANMYSDPRAFSIAAGKTFDVVKLIPGDIFKMSKDEFTTVPAVGTTTYAYPTTNGKLVANASAAGKQGLVLKLIAPEQYNIGMEFVDAYIMEVIQNPTKALA